MELTQASGRGPGMPEIRPHPVVPFPPRKAAPTRSFSVGSWVGLGAGQGLGLQEGIPGLPISCVPTGWGFRERLGVVGFRGEGLSNQLITLSFPLYFSLPAPHDSLDIHFSLFHPSSSFLAPLSPSLPSPCSFTLPLTHFHHSSPTS